MDDRPPELRRLIELACSRNSQARGQIEELIGFAEQTDHPFVRDALTAYLTQLAEAHRPKAAEEIGRMTQRISTMISRLQAQRRAPSRVPQQAWRLLFLAAVLLLGVLFALLLPLMGSRGAR